MDLTCFQCKKSWEVSQAHILGAKLKFGLGFKDHGFVCPNCNTKNIITKATFEAELAEPPHPAASVAPKPAAPVAVKPAAPVSKPAAAPMPATKPIFGMSAPTAPVIGAGPVMAKERHGTVIVRSLHVRKDHSTSSETLAGLVKGEKVTVMSTWADGDNVWAQLGPDRWAAVVYKGEALIELSD